MTRIWAAYFVFLRGFLSLAGTVRMAATIARLRVRSLLGRISATTPSGMNGLICLTAAKMKNRGAHGSACGYRRT